MRKIYTWLEICVPLQEEAQHRKPPPNHAMTQKTVLASVMKEPPQVKKKNGKKGVLMNLPQDMMLVLKLFLENDV